MPASARRWVVIAAVAAVSMAVVVVASTPQRVLGDQRFGSSQLFPPRWAYFTSATAAGWYAPLEVLPSGELHVQRYGRERLWQLGLDRAQRQRFNLLQAYAHGLDASSWVACRSERCPIPSAPLAVPAPPALRLACPSVVVGRVVAGDEGAATDDPNLSVVSITRIACGDR
jgi:hypothetical protein